MPGIALEIARDNFLRMPLAQLTKRGDIEAEMVRAIRVEVPNGEEKKSRGWPEPASIFCMRGPQELLLQMNERACSLDEAFIISVIFVAPLQPRCSSTSCAS